MSDTRNDFKGFKPPDPSGPAVNKPMLIVLSICCGLAAAGSWFVISEYVIAQGWSLGWILLPLLAGSTSGFIMMRFGGDFGKAGCMGACIATGVGCIIGDQLHVIYFTGKPLSQLYGDELQMTLNSTLQLQDAMLIAIAVWLTFLFTKPRMYQSQVATG